MEEQCVERVGENRDDDDDDDDRSPHGSMIIPPPASELRYLFRSCDTIDRSRIVPVDA